MFFFILLFVDIVTDFEKKNRLNWGYMTFYNIFYHIFLNEKTIMRLCVVIVVLYI